MSTTDAPTGASAPFDPSGTVAVVTGATGGIGAALVRALGAAGAALVVATDLDDRHTRAVAERIDDELPVTTVIGRGLDVTDAAATEYLVREIESDHGPIELFCANAGIGTASGYDTPPELWHQVWEVNVMAHVTAARVLVPRWLGRGRGHLLVTASAAGLLTNLGDAPYSATKHAAVGFAEWLAITHGAEGIGVCCLCPQGVRTPMVLGPQADEFAALRRTSGDEEPGQPTPLIDRDDALAIQVVRDQGLLEPSAVADAALAALAEGRFLALPHPEVARYEQARAADHDRWIAGMRRLAGHLAADPPSQ